MPDNSVTIIGNVTRDPELRFTASGQATATFGLAKLEQVERADAWQEALGRILGIDSCFERVPVDLELLLHKRQRLVVGER